MPEYLSPGVYVEEFEIGAKPIEGVSTSTAGMVGVTEKGPVEGLPELVTSFAEFERKFGGFLGDEWKNARFLPFAVQGFFQNGGQRAFIKRVVGDNTSFAHLTLKEGNVTRLQEDMANDLEGRMEAKLVSMRGIYVGKNITFEEKTSSGAIVKKIVSVTSYEENKVSWQSALDYKFTKAGTRVIVGSEPATETIDIKAKDPGKWGEKISVLIESASKTSSLLQAMDVKKAILGLPLEFVSNGPAIGALEVALTPSSALKVNTQQWVEFRNSSGNIEKRRITSKSSGTISWSGTGGGGALANNYSTNSTINLLDIKVNKLAFEGDVGPASGVTSATLTISCLLKVNTDDWVEFRKTTSGGEAELRKITTITQANATSPIVISWAATGEGGGALVNSYSADSTINLLTYFLRVDNTTGLSVGDRVKLRKEDQYDDAIVDSPIDLTNNKIRLKLISRGLSRDYNNEDILESATAARQNANSVTLASVSNFYVGAIVEFDTGKIKEYKKITNIDGDRKTLTWAVAEKFDNMYLGGNQARTCEFKLTITYTPDFGTPIFEIFDNLSMDSSTDNYFKNIINEDSKLVTVDDKNLESNPPGNIPTTLNGLPDFLFGGNNGQIPKDKHYIGEDKGPGNRTGIKSLVDIDDINIVAVPGIASQDVQNAIIEHCEIVMKDRFAVLDPSKGLKISEIQLHRNLYDSKYAAIYYPWLMATDPLVDKTIAMPPSGHMIGIYARSDTQKGVHKAPANEVIQGITGVELQINKGEQDILNPKGINAIRIFPGSGIRVWGARTISSDSLWKYINVRRLFLYVEESIYKGTQWVVFEPNNEKLWGRVKATIDEFLMRVWRDGALMGMKAEEAYFIKCDRTTMTQGDIDNGRLICVIGIAPVKPAEFVIFRIAQWAGGSAAKE